METVEAIQDAGLFRVGHNATFHKLARTAGVRVSAVCGAYGYVDYFRVYPAGWRGQDVDTRPAYWASGYSGAGCPTCGADRL